MKATYNTKKRGAFRFLVLGEKDGDFVGICLDLNIIEHGKDPQTLLVSVIDAAVGLLEGVRSKNLSDDCLNTPAPLKYWRMMEQAEKFLSQKRQSSQKRINPLFFHVTQQPYQNYSSLKT